MEKIVELKDVGLEVYPEAAPISKQTNDKPVLREDNIFFIVS